MTSQTLMTNTVLDLPRVQSVDGQSSESCRTASSSSSSNSSTDSLQPAKLPYQASHQVELLHLQAETEALLQQLQTLKQQRLATPL